MTHVSRDVPSVAFRGSALARRSEHASARLRAAPRSSWRPPPGGPGGCGGARGARGRGALARAPGGGGRGGGGGGGGSSGGGGGGGGGALRRCRGGGGGRAAPTARGHAERARRPPSRAR